MESFSTLKLGRAFFEKPAIDLSRDLLGVIMVRRIGQTLRRARIIETEAYVGPKDLASHASKGRTARTEVMFGTPGTAYVYFIYGLHQMFNIVSGPAGSGQAVLIRAAEPLDDWQVDLLGPARLARGFAITPADNRRDITADEIYFYSDPDYQPRIIKTKRIGVDYARHWKDRLLRFIDVNNPQAKKLKR